MVLQASPCIAHWANSRQSDLSLCFVFHFTDIQREPVRPVAAGACADRGPPGAAAQGGRPGPRLCGRRAAGAESPVESSGCSNALEGQVAGRCLRLDSSRDLPVDDVLARKHAAVAFKLPDVAYFDAQSLPRRRQCSRCSCTGCRSAICRASKRLQPQPFKVTRDKCREGGGGAAARQLCEYAVAAASRQPLRHLLIPVISAAGAGKLRRGGGGGAAARQPRAAEGSHGAQPGVQPLALHIHHHGRRAASVTSGSLLQQKWRCTAVACPQASV